MISTIEKTIIAKPFLKWAGGKTQLLDEIEKRLPKGISTGHSFVKLHRGIVGLQCGVVNGQNG
jgi:hypothetical protein